MALPPSLAAHSELAEKVPVLNTLAASALLIPEGREKESVRADTHRSAAEQAFQVPRYVREPRSNVVFNQELTADHGSCCRAVAALWY